MAACISVIGSRGVFWHKGAGKWMAQIAANKKVKYLGLYPSKEEARRAYLVAAGQYHGEFARESL